MNPTIKLTLRPKSCQLGALLFLLLSGASSSALAAEALTIRDVANWSDMGYSATAIRTKLTNASPQPHFSQADLQWLQQTGASPTLVEVVRPLLKAPGTGSSSGETKKTGGGTGNDRAPLNPNPFPPLGRTGGETTPGGATTGDFLAPLDFALEVGQKNGKIVITSAAHNPFAAILELRAGDILLSIDGKSTNGLSVEQVRALMRGSATAKPEMILEIQRLADGEQVTVAMPRAGSASAGGAIFMGDWPGGQNRPEAKTEGTPVDEAKRKQAEPFLDKGMALSAESQWAQAETQYRQALRLDPTYDYAWIMLAEACQEQKKWPEAALAYRELIKLSPQTGANHADLANVLLRQGKRAEALREAREAIRLGEKEHPVFEELGLSK